MKQLRAAPDVKIARDESGFVDGSIVDALNELPIHAPERFPDELPAAREDTPTIRVKPPFLPGCSCGDCMIPTDGSGV